MTAVTAELVAKLRAATGFGMMECKKALVEASGDIEEATRIMRVKTGAKVSKLAQRVTAEGVVVAATGAGAGVLVEINCETDFVAKDENFTKFAQKVAEAVLQHAPNSVDDISQLIDADSGQTFEQQRQEVVAKLGENISIRRFQRFAGDNHVIVYTHNNNISAMLEFTGDNNQVIRQIAMHIAAQKPSYAYRDKLDPSIVERERNICIEQIKSDSSNAKKPDHIIEKMIAGRLEKVLADSVLSLQSFIFDPSKTVQQVLNEQKAEIIRFAVFQVGEGIEKKTVDYAAEVAAAAKV